MKKILLVFSFFFICSNAFPQSKVDTFMTAFLKKHNFNGTILIERGSKPIYKKKLWLCQPAFQSSQYASYKI